MRLSWKGVWGWGALSYLFMGCSFTPTCDSIPSDIEDPVGLVVSPVSGDLLVSSGDLTADFCSGQVVIVDDASNTIADRVETRLGGEASGRRHLLGEIAVNAEGTLAYLTERTSSRLLVLNLSSGAFEADVPMGTDPFAVAYSALADLVLVGNLGSDSVTVVDGSSFSVLATIALTQGEFGARPSGIAVRSDGLRAFVTHQLSNRVSVIDLDSSSSTYLTEVSTIEIENGSTALNSRGIAASPVSGVNEVYIGNRDPNSIVVIDTERLRVVDLIDLPSDCDGPDGVAATASGEIFVACSETDTVVVFDQVTREFKDGISVGDGPQAMAASPDGLRIYVANLIGESVSVIDNDPNSETRFTVIATIE